MYQYSLLQTAYRVTLAHNIFQVKSLIRCGRHELQDNRNYIYWFMFPG